MVNSRFIKCFFTLTILAASFLTSNISLASNSKLILFIDKSESILGRPIRAELYGVSLDNKVTDINLSTLRKEFGVTIDYVINDTTDKRWPNQSVQILKFKLYPRRTGEILIPSITSADTKTNDKTIYITTKNTSLPKVSLSSSNPYKHQQFNVNVSVISKEPTSRLAIKKGFDIKGFESIPLPFVRIKRKDGKYINKIGWSITALKSGKIKLTLPPVGFSVSGVSRKQFYFPHATINIKSLPTYLSPTVTVGDVILQSELPNYWYLKTNSISYWNIKIKGDVNNAYRLPGILKQIKSNNKIRFLPAIIKRSTNYIDNRLISTTIYSIPFKPLTNGFFEFPKLLVQFFDFNTGKIETTTYRFNNALSLNIIWLTLIYISVFTFISYILFIGYNKYIKFSQSKKCRNKALCILENSNNIIDIKTSIQLLTKSECWKENITLHQWGMRWRKKYTVNNHFDELIEQTSDLFYRENSRKNINEIGLQLYEAVKYRK